MRTLVTVCLLIVVTHVTALSQEDVLRPNGRAKSSGAAPSGVVTPDEPPAIPRSGPVIRGGVEGGLGLNMLSKSISGVIETSPLGMFTSASGVSALFALYAEIELSPSISLGLRVTDDEKYVYGSATGLLQDCLVTDANGTPLQVTVTSMSGEFTQTISYVALNPLVRIGLSDNLFVQVGPTVLLNASSLRAETTLTIDPDEECSFNFGQPNQSKVSSTVAEDADLPGMRLGLDAAIGYRLPIGGGFEIVPRLGYQMMFTPIDKESTGLDTSREATLPPARTFVAGAATLNSLQASLSLWFRL